ncbi:MAG: thiamine-phosphate kinase [Acidobacteriota bacterium]|nr:MAG: thiamine-phosphate kinase [Acidobacteriota bacterium]
MECGARGRRFIHQSLYDSGARGRRTPQMTEFEFISRIRDQVRRRLSAPSDLVVGIGDDTAVLREQTGRETLITTDLLVEDVDFRLDYAPPEWLGHKTLAVSLSDIAAMGGAPAFSLLTLSIPKPASLHEEFWEAFFEGYFSLCERHVVTLVGGDISSTPGPLSLDSIVIGHARSGHAVKRSGARPGDAIYLTGSIGASAAGLKLLLDGARIDSSEESLVQRALRSHIRPEPRTGFGRRVGDESLAHSMIDLSDGLSRDLAHICEESLVAAIVDYDAVPIAVETSLIHHDPWQAFLFAVSGGEDFELLLTADPENEPALIKAADGLPLTRIGEIVDPRAAQDVSPLLLRRNGALEPLPVRGFNHFG